MHGGSLRVELKENMIIETLSDLQRHISHVQNDCTFLGIKLINEGFEYDGKNLIANGQVHDNSKYSGIEWEGLFQTDNEALLKSAIYHHNHTNKHHPEANNGIHNMSKIYLAECVADWHARSSEFGSDLSSWIIKSATNKYHFTIKDRVYKDIKYFVNLLLDKPFKRLK